MSTIAIDHPASHDRGRKGVEHHRVAALSAVEAARNPGASAESKGRDYGSALWQTGQILRQLDIELDRADVADVDALRRDVRAGSVSSSDLEEQTVGRLRNREFRKAHVLLMVLRAL